MQFSPKKKTKKKERKKERTKERKRKEIETTLKKNNRKHQLFGFQALCNT